MTAGRGKRGGGGGEGEEGRRRGGGGEGEGQEPERLVHKGNKISPAVRPYLVSPCTCLAARVVQN